MICPICKNKGNTRYRPFCSKRCADIDLGRWFDGSYSITLDSNFDVEEEIEKTSNGGKIHLDRWE